MAAVALIVLLGLAVTSAFPTDQVLFKPDDGLRFQHVQGPEGKLYLQDFWVKASSLDRSARYDADQENEYHLFTRLNPSVSQPIVMGNSNLLGSTNFDPQRRTIVLIHGWLNDATGTVNTVLVPAFLAAEDVNVIVVDWSAGADTPSYPTAVANVVPSGEAVAHFINWLNGATGATPSQYHLVGHSLGGHQVGIVGRNVDGDIAYITSLDPAGPNWETNEDRLRKDDGAYTEVIHTNAGTLGFESTLGHVDFYPNGGIDMPGCSGMDCDHDRCFYYLAESLQTGGFTGTLCATYDDALIGNCTLSGSLNMGGLEPKTGQTGIYWLETNAAPPFSQG